MRDQVGKEPVLLLGGWVPIALDLQDSAEGREEGKEEQHGIEK